VRKGFAGLRKDFDVTDEDMEDAFAVKEKMQDEQREVIDNAE